LEQIEAIANANKESLDLAYVTKQRAMALLREVNEGRANLKRVGGGGGNRKVKPSPRLSSAMASISEHDDVQEDDILPRNGTDPSASVGQLDGALSTSFEGKGSLANPSVDESYSEVEYDSDTESSSSSSSTSSSDTDSSDEDGEESSLESPGGSSSSSSSESSSDTGDEEEDVSKKGNLRRLTSTSNSVDAEQQDITSRARSLSQNSSEIVPAGISNGMQIIKPQRSKPAPRKTRMKFRTIFTDDLPPFVLEIDDETDKDIAAVVSDWTSPNQFDWTNLSVSYNK
jgi:hypothetical protein